MGLRKGGPTVFLAALLRPRKLVSLDISGPVKLLETFRAEHPIGKHVASVYETSQDDEAALRKWLGDRQA